MKKSLAIVLPLIALVGVGSPTRSSLGACHSKFSPSEEAFDNPYVTDGLVAMWDAEWNAGWGKHDSSGGLIELVSKTPTYIRRGSYVVDFDCLRCDAVVIASPAIPAIVAMAGGDLTIEGCCTRTARGIVLGGNRPFFADNTGGFYWSNGGYYMVHGGLADAAFSSKWASGFHTEERRTRTLSASMEVVQWWLNGIADTSAPRTKDLITTTNPFAVFGWDFDYNFPESGMFCCLRIYNRALSAEEIAWNFAVDQARFGL